MDRSLFVVGAENIVSGMGRLVLEVVRIEPEAERWRPEAGRLVTGSGMVEL